MRAELLDFQNTSVLCSLFSSLSTASSFYTVPQPSTRAARISAKPQPVTTVHFAMSAESLAVFRATGREDLQKLAEEHFKHE